MVLELMNLIQKVSCREDSEDHTYSSGRWNRVGTGLAPDCGSWTALFMRGINVP